MTAPTPPLVPISWGELLDKITILETKDQHIADPAARANVRRELALLRAAAAPIQTHADAARLTGALKQVNQRLWDIEDEIRALEAAQTFDAAFIAAARAVYFTNDRRGALKRQINAVLGSDLTEVKSYTAYPGEPPV